MKNQQIFPFSVLLLAVGAAAQTNTLPTSGNVGIGTMSPTAVLQVVNPVNANGQVGFPGSLISVGSKSSSVQSKFELSCCIWS
jgi:hypothetical protein